MMDSILNEIKNTIEVIRRSSDRDLYDKCVEGLSPNAKAYADLTISNLSQIGEDVPYTLIRESALEIH